MSLWSLAKLISILVFQRASCRNQLENKLVCILLVYFKEQPCRRRCCRYLCCCILVYCAHTSVADFNAEFGIFPLWIPIASSQSRPQWCWRSIYTVHIKTASTKTLNKKSLVTDTIDNIANLRTKPHWKVKIIITQAHVQCKINILYLWIFERFFS